MTRDEFWQLIEGARQGADDAYEVAERVHAALVERGIDATRAYLEHEARLLEESYTWDLWGAACMLHGGCSDDSFDYFRGWLLAQGRDVWERALADPDSLASRVTEGDLEEGEVDTDSGEDLIHAGSRAFNDLSGDYPDGPRIRLPDLGEPRDFDDDAEMRKRYPRLCDLFFGS